jgi:UDP-galactopyranose mutase
MSKYDHIIVGAGLWGSTYAHFAKQIGKKILVVDKAEHIGGNCYTKNDDGINVHVYGPHIFHVSDERVWNFVNKFAKFNHFVNRPKVNYKGKLFSFPLNLFTLYQLWDVKTPEEAKKKLEQVRIPIDNPKNMEDWCLSQVGEEIYETFIKGYSTKQWKTEPKNLPSSIIRRLPIRMTFDDNYFEDHHQGIPIGGYTQIFEKMLDGVEVQLGVDFFKDRTRLEGLLKSDGKLIYTGRVDALYNYDQGELPYRNLRFEHQRLEIPDFQGNAVVNYTEADIPYTRITEHKHFEFGKTNHTVITHEYPIDYERDLTPYYPVNNDENNARARAYNARAESDGIIVGGRLGKYLYMDMHAIIPAAMTRFEKETGIKINEKGELDRPCCELDRREQKFEVV